MTRLVDLIQDEASAKPFEAAFAMALQDTLAMVLDKLSEREMRIIKLRFGLDGEGPFTLEETGKILGITRERVRQIQERAIVKLKQLRVASELEAFMQALSRLDTRGCRSYNTIRLDEGTRMLTTYSLSGLTVVTPDDRRLRLEHHRRPAQAGQGGLHGASSTCTSAAGTRPFPALINVHDHFNGNYLPRVGPPPGGVLPELVVLGQGPEGLRRGQDRAPKTTVEQRYFLSAYKNLFSGVVTANDHFPHEWNEPFLPRLPIRADRASYTLAHECSSFDLKWGDGIEIEHARAQKGNLPFITHLEEGFDEETQRGIEILEELGCLDDHDVFIHCIGFSDEDIQKTPQGRGERGLVPRLQPLHVQRHLQGEEDARGGGQRGHRHGLHRDRLGQPAGGDALRAGDLAAHVRRGAPRPHDRGHGDAQRRPRPSACRRRSAASPRASSPTCW